jgi:plasmid stability protein
MAQVLIRKVEKEVVLGLKERAKANGRSLEAELRLILQEASKPVEPVNRMEILARVRKQFEGRRFSDSTQLIREDRDR